VFHLTRPIPWILGLALLAVAAVWLWRRPADPPDPAPAALAPRAAAPAWASSGPHEVHIGEGDDFRHQAWDQELVERIHAATAFADTIRVVFHEREEPYAVDFDLLDFSSLDPGSPFIALELQGAGPHVSDGGPEANGRVRILPSGGLWMGDRDLSMSDLGFEGGGQISSEPLVTVGSGSLSIWDTDISDIVFNHMAPVAYLTVLDGPLHLSRVTLVGNMFTFGIAAAPVVHLTDCLIADNHWQIEPPRQFYNSAITVEDTLIAVGTTFHGNWNTGGLLLDSFDITLPADAHAELANCLFTGSHESGCGGTCPKIQNPGGGGVFTDLSILHCATDQDQWAAGIAAFAHPSNRFFPPDSLDAVVRYVDSAAGDFRLRWDSELLDKGDPDPALNDFDLTRSDIGWTPRYAVTNLGPGAYTDDLLVGHYQISGNTLLRGAIAPGSTIRVKHGVLSIRADASAFERRIGDLTQPRTAIVGRETPGSDHNTSIKFENTSPYYEELAHLRFEGVLFSIAPRSATPLLIFTDWDIPMGGVILDGGSVQFRNWSSVSGLGGVVDGGIQFDGCTGVVSGLSFGESIDTPGYLQLKDSRVNVENCTFTPSLNATPDRPCLKLINDLVGETPLLLGNIFIRNPNLPDHRAPFLDIWSAFANLRHNRFLDCRDTPLVMSQSVLHADQEARNDLRASPQFQLNSPLVHLEGGYLDLFCGRNNFVARLVDGDNPLVSWAASDTLLTPATVSWRENYWGRFLQCFNPVPDAELNDQSLSLLPPWANADDNLAECVDVTTPVNPACPFEPYTPYELLKNGKLAEQAEDWTAAQENYRWLLQLHAMAKECTEGTLRLKALGLHKTHGPEAYESVRDDLFAGADSSDAIRSFHQAMLQDCGGWCVEARWGNREAAVDTLEALFEIEADPLNKDTIAMALLEIATYPPQGGLSAAGPEALVARSVARQQAIDDLFAYKRGQGLATADARTLPLRFEISNLYPNPFNARTTVEYALPRDGLLRLRVYNLLGQLADTAFDANALAGRHRLVLDGSDWASGLYFVAAEFDGGVQLRKMMLIK
jgi:hypothetical protein